MKKLLKFLNNRKFIFLFKKAMLLFLALLCVCNIIFSYYKEEQFNLGVTVYSESSDKIQGSIKITVISDLHNHCFGEDNCELIEKVREGNPDIICVTGDIVTNHRGKPCDKSVIKPLMAGLAEIAPVYYLPGNHEINISANDPTIFDEIVESDATYVRNGYFDIEINGNIIRIGGITASPEKNWKSGYAFDAFCNDEAADYKILMVHDPYVAKDLMNGSFDLCLSGHVHGGQIIIGKSLGICGPSYRLFPKYNAGEYDFDGSKLIVSRGLGNAIAIPRINNNAELVEIVVNGNA